MESTRKQLTQQQLKELLNYEKDTGIFTWKNPRANRCKPGDIAGAINRGYLLIGITVDGIALLYGAHRLAWLYEYGRFPNKDIDHINHDKSDNRISNLREVNHITNMKNQKIRSTNKSGFTGVSWDKNLKKWRAMITVNRTNMHLGCFTDKNDAIEARLHANRLYKFHPNHGKC